MCANCGCSNYRDDMGHPENITDKTVTALGQKWGLDIHGAEEIVLAYLNGQAPDAEKTKEIEEMFDKASKAWGQSVDDAKNETKKVLARELGK